MKYFILLLSLIALTSCAGSYEPISPKTVSYFSRGTDPKILFEYKYVTLNKKYQKKADKKNIKVLAVKVTNKTSSEILLGRDYELVYQNGALAQPMENEVLYKEKKQSPAIYLLYLLLTPLQFQSSSSNGTTESTSSTPIGLVVGPGITAYNMLHASAANKKFKKELAEYNLMGKAILPGQTVDAIIALDAESAETLDIKSSGSLR